MGCSICGSKVASTLRTGEMVSINYRIKQNQGPCEYTVEQLRFFEEKLMYFKDKALYVKQNMKPSLVNKYIGIVLTSLNINNRCMYKEKLDKIKDLVDLIITL
jgi:hypothetical protein